MQELLLSHTVPTALWEQKAAEAETICSPSFAAEYC